MEIQWLVWEVSCYFQPPQNCSTTFRQRASGRKSGLVDAAFHPSATAELMLLRPLAWRGADVSFVFMSPMYLLIGIRRYPDGFEVAGRQRGHGAAKAVGYRDNSKNDRDG